jgi:molecular chaperone DnaK (HSP70)
MCHSILKYAKVSMKYTDEVILTGGMTRVPRYRELFLKFLATAKAQERPSTQAMVIGSAIQAALLEEDELGLSGNMIPLYRN